MTTLRRSEEFGVDSIIDHPSIIVEPSWEILEMVEVSRSEKISIKRLEVEVQVVMLVSYGRR